MDFSCQKKNLPAAKQEACGQLLKVKHILIGCRLYIQTGANGPQIYRNSGLEPRTQPRPEQKILFFVTSNNLIDNI